MTHLSMPSTQELSPLVLNVPAGQYLQQCQDQGLKWEAVSLEVEGHRLAAIAANRSASGCPIVFIHGITASINFWLPSIPAALRDHHPWYSLSLPGHFPAIAPADFNASLVTPEHFATVLGNAIQQLVGDQPVKLVGHSTGGFATLLLAALRPELVDSVLCISGFVQGPWTGSFGFLQRLARRGPMAQSLFKGLLRFSASLPRRYRISSLFHAANWKAYWQSPLLAPTLEMTRLDSQQHDLATLATIFAQVFDLDITSLLTQIHAPVTVVAGEKDPLIPFEQAKIMMDNIAQAKLVLLQGAGHMFFAESTEPYQQLLLDWSKA